MATQRKNTSSSMLKITSSQGIPPLPPVSSRSQKNAENAAKKTTPVFTKTITGTGINQAMARELKKLKDTISSVPGVVKPIPEIPDGSQSELILAMQNLGDKARWPRKSDKPATTKDKSKWCAYHEDFGHLTDECIALRKGIGYLLSKGYLKELFGRKKSRIQDSEKVLEKVPPPPADDQIIYFISGGSDICGTSFPAAKRHAKKTKMENGDRHIRTSVLTQEKDISFDEDNQVDIQDPRHDSVVITLFISNHFIHRILIDGGSSVNIIQLDILKRMNILESDIVLRSPVLVGFSGETKNTLGDIKLPIYIEGAMDSHMKAVPSTYHQCVKLPTP
ncbi:uncharacterized protein LOC118488879 [Helianthus annuus]|uniref:uncharacterized protein LOC118488879 n=1 Tax=Helianthus annuus TaxID=4232 RepID=UPI001652E817|nr:uncharacterized protein LOC118488879 [Helianthus annuus]